MYENIAMWTWIVVVAWVTFRMVVRDLQVRVQTEIHNKPPAKPQPVIEGGSMPGMCANCNALRPCSCGEYCPTCLSDVRWNDDGSVTCKGCGMELKKAST